MGEMTRQQLQEYLESQLAHLEQRQRAAVSAAADSVQLEQYGTAAVHLHEAARVKMAREELLQVLWQVRTL